MNWDILSQKFPIAKGHPAGAIHAHHVLVILAKFDCNTCLVPFGGVNASFVLYPHMITNFKRGKLSCVRSNVQLQSWPKLLGRSALPPSPQFNVEILSFLSGEATQRCTGGGGGIISSSYMNSSV